MRDNFDYKSIASQLGHDPDTFEQPKVINKIKNPMASSWTVVYDFSNKIYIGPHIYACFAKPRRESEILSGQDWMCNPYSFTPGFCTSHDGTNYMKRLDEDFEHIVAEQYFYAIDKSCLHLNQEFVLLFELYRGPDANYYHVDDCGNMTPVVKFEDNKVSILTKYLLRFMAAKQLLYVQFIDSRVASSPRCPYTASLASSYEENGDNYNYSNCFSCTPSNDYLLSVIYARSIVRPGPVEECGICPYEKEDDFYPEYMIQENPDGSIKRYTCNPDLLANYFGANPEAPHYLTPVYFDPEVLQKYRGKSNFTVTEYRITCGSKWGVEIDHHDPRRVMVYLGDLGRDLPASERKHFLGYEMSPLDQHITKESFALDFLNVAIGPTGPVGKMLVARRGLQSSWKNTFGSRLYRELHDDDSHLTNTIRVPTPNDTEGFENSIIELTRYLIEYMDVKAFDKSPRSGSINLLEDHLANYDIHADISALRDLQTLRSTGTAHAKGSKYDKTKARLLSGDYQADMIKLLNRLTECLDTIVNELANMS